MNFIKESMTWKKYFFRLSRLRNRMLLIRGRILLKVDGFRVSFNSFISGWGYWFTPKLADIMVVKKLSQISTLKNMESLNLQVIKIFSKSLMIHLWKWWLSKALSQDLKNSFLKQWEFSTNKRK